jgi:hypothetical protein
LALATGHATLFILPSVYLWLAPETKQKEEKKQETETNWQAAGA